MQAVVKAVNTSVMVAFCDLKAICRWKLGCNHSLHFSSISYAWRATMKTTQFKRCQEQVNCRDLSFHSQNSSRKSPEIIQKWRNTTSKFYFCVTKYTVLSKLVFWATVEKVIQQFDKLLNCFHTNEPTDQFHSSPTASDSHNCRGPTNKILFWELQTCSSFLCISMGTNNQTAKMQNKI